MAHQRLPSPPASSTLRRAASAGVTSGARAALALALGGGWLAGCAGLLGIEDATCDSMYDSRCAGRSVGTLMPSAGTGGATPTANAGAAGSAGAAGGDGAGAGGAPGTDEPMEAPLCERYCDTIAAACIGANQQYASIMACLAVCALLEPGDPGDELGNNVECRLNQAELAQDTGERSFHCYKAGPGGGDVCGADCEGFCTIMAKTCPLMGSYAQCSSLCSEVPNLSEDEEDPITYDVSIQNGDSVQCRLYHVTAATLDSRTHCSHAAGVALCVP